MRNLLVPTLALLATSACAADEGALDPDPVPVTTPALEIELAADTARVIRAQTVEVRVRLEHRDTEGPFTVTAEDLPAGVTAAPITIAAGESEGVLLLAAGEDLALGTVVTATIRASAPDVEAAAPLDLRLTDRPGALDRSFGDAGAIVTSFGPGSHEVGTAIARLPDGKLLVAGVDVTNREYLLARYDEQGAPDPGFGSGTGWMPISNSGVEVTAPSLAVRTDGSVLLGTYAGPTAIIYGLDAHGDLLPAFGNSGGLTVLNVDTVGAPFYFRAMRATADGGCFVVGESTSATLVARLGPDGKLDPSFDGDGVASFSFGSGMGVSALAVRPDGRIVVGGWTNPPNSGSIFALAQLTADGALDPAFDGDGRLTFDSGTTSFAVTATALRDGRIAVTSGGGDGAILLVDGDGAYTLRSLGSLVARTVLETDEGIVAIGGSGVDLAIARVTTGGAMDARFGTDGVSFASLPSALEIGIGATLDADGRVLITGLAQDPGPEEGDLLLTRVWL